jgi:hypothetical protein
MLTIPTHVNRIQHRAGVAPKSDPTTRAIIGADLWLNGTYGISTGTQAAAIVNVSRPLIDAARIVLQSEDKALLAQVLSGFVSLTNAAAKAKRRAELIAAFNNADPNDRAALGAVVVAGVEFSRVVVPAL